MISSNFHFIQKYQPALAELANSAENYAYSDPQSAIVKLRCFAEIYVGFIYNKLSLPVLDVSNLFEKLDNAAFRNAVEECIVEKLHLIRLKGNRAAHPGGVSITDALKLVKEAYFLSGWIYISFHGGRIEDWPKYREPQPVRAEDEAVLADKQRLEQVIDQQTADLERAKAELIAAQKQQQEALEQLASLNQVVDLPQLETVQQAGQNAVDNYDFEVETTRKHIKMEDVFAEYRLTSGQSKLVERLDDFLANREKKVFQLKGYAGTGKTFITKGLTEYLRSIGRNYILAAPTGKAAKVIASKTRSKAFTIHKTIYSFKDIKQYIEDDLEGSETYKFYADLAVNDLSVDTVYIIDESSMISDVYSEAEFFRFGSGYLLRDFLKFVNLDHNDHHKKVIFIGDDAQLPPVGMNNSPALDSGYLLEEYGLASSSFELTEVVRQKADSGVMHNAVKMRDALKVNVFNTLDFDLNYPDLAHVEHQDLISAYLDSCDHKINAESIVIAHSNADVAAYNKRIREELFPGQLSIANGDKVMSVSNNDTYGFFISNGDFGLVRKVLGEKEERLITIRRKLKETGKVEEIIVPLQFREIEAGFRDLDGNPCFFNAKIVENLLYSDSPNLSSDENKALFLDFCIRHSQLKRGTLEFKNTLRSDPYFNALRLKFGYAITCHKAQGSEWPHVFVKCKTHQNQLCAEYFRWLYTAITRTTSKLYLLDEPHIKLGSGIKLAGNPGLMPSHESVHLISTTSLTAGVPSDELSRTKSSEHVTTIINKFGIPDSNDFLLGLLSEVNGLIADSAAEIHDIQHNQYQEAYVFAKASEVARINLFYNGEQKITSVVLSQPSELGGELHRLLNPLKGRVLVGKSAHAEGKDFVFTESFLEVFHQRLEEAARASDIDIIDVVPQQYSQRYFFHKHRETVAVDIYYNKKQQFAHYNPVANLCTSTTLLNEIGLLITKGLA